MQEMIKRAQVVCVAVAGLLVVAASSGFAAQEDFETQVQRTIERFKMAEPRTRPFFENAYGFVVFPRIEKGAAGIAAASGEGLVFEDRRPTGLARMSQFTFGVQVGGGTYAQVVFFEDRAAMDRFMRYNTLTTSQVTASKGDETASDHGIRRPGVLVFNLAETGVFLEASAGGEKITFCPFAQ